MNKFITDTGRTYDCFGSHEMRFDDTKLADLRHRCKDKMQTRLSNIGVKHHEFIHLLSI